MKRLKSKFIFISVVFGIIALAIGSYFWLIQKQPKSKEFTGVREKVTICYGEEPLGALVMIAQEQAFFSQAGLEVTGKTYPTGKKAVEGMFKGECTIATVAATPIIFRSFEQQDSKIFATISSSDNEPRIIARKDSGIQKPHDLKGKHIATQEASSVHFFLHLFLLKNGLSERDVKISFKEANELPEALARGEVDAFSMRQPFISKASKLLGDKAVIFAEPGLYHKTFNLLALNSFIKDKPEVIKRVLRALIRGEEFAKKHPNQAVKIVSQKLKIDESEITILWPELDLRVSLEQSLLLILEDEARWAIKNKLTGKTKVPNYLDFIYLDGLKEVKPEAVTIIR